LSARFVVLSCTGVGFATFFLKTKKHASSVGPFCRPCGLGCPSAYALAVSVRLSAIVCRQEVLVLPCASVCLPLSSCRQKNVRAVSALPFAWSFRLAVPSSSRFFHAQPLSCIS
jgi:hypothetical protein